MMKNVFQVPHKRRKNILSHKLNQDLTKWIVQLGIVFSHILKVDV